MLLKILSNSLNSFGESLLLNWTNSSDPAELPLLILLIDSQTSQAQVIADSGIINQICVTCISGDAGAAWFIEAHLFGDGTIATPFDDQ